MKRSMKIAAIALAGMVLSSCRSYMPPQAAPVSRASRPSASSISYGNEYIRWVHDSKTGRLTGAYVLNDSEDNLLTSPLDVRMALEKSDGTLETYSAGMPSLLKFNADGVSMTYGLCRQDGSLLPGVTVDHDIRYGDWGEAEHHLRLHVAQPIVNLREFTPVVLTAADKFDTYGVKNMLAWSWGLSGVQKWESLKTESDVVYQNARPPLYMLMFERGGAGIEFCMGDNVAAWDALGGAKRGQLVHDRQNHSYVFTASAFAVAEKRTLEGTYDYRYRLTLPFVRRRMCPIRPAAGLYYFERGSEKRWPTDEDFAAMRDAGLTLLRLHNDCDNQRDGIFWRDAIYPPYPPKFMAAMDDCLARAAKYGIAIVPYFSLKEMHPEAKEFAEHGTEWAKLTKPEDGIWITRWKDLVFGGVMCLKSGWMKKRCDTIEEVLRNHAFSGVYFDWCTAIECNNRRHAAARHWDIDEHIKLLKWSNALKGPNGEQYLHMTKVPLLIAENMATLLLTEESSFPDIGPEMFTPHVHFMNTAPRSICNMLNKPTADDNRKLAMMALLHHATVAEKDVSTLDVYKKNRAWMEAVTDYEHHYAPGEGHTSADNKKVGVSFYESRNGSSMAVLANLTKETVEVSYDCQGRYARQSGKVSIGPLEMKAIRK